MLGLKNNSANIMSHIWLLIFNSEPYKAQNRNTDKAVTLQFISERLIPVVTDPTSATRPSTVVPQQCFRSMLKSLWHAIQQKEIAR
ncbi:MAG: hypothetical protein ACI9ZF_000316 [Bradyrhizobium sp.]|jgi:hypothetical protein